MIHHTYINNSSKFTSFRMESVSRIESIQIITIQAMESINIPRTSHTQLIHSSFTRFYHTHHSFYPLSLSFTKTTTQSHFHLHSLLLIQQTSFAKCDVCEPSLRRSLLLLRALLLVVLLRIRDSLGLQTLNEMSILPSELAGQMTNSDVGTVRSILHSICFELYLR